VPEEQIGVEFDIVGLDTFGMRRTLVSRIPFALLRSRFRFHRPKTRAELPGFWQVLELPWCRRDGKIFPMSALSDECRTSGHCDASWRHGRTSRRRANWLAHPGHWSRRPRLCTLRRCLAASPAERASMGRTAAETVQRLCNNEQAVDAQITFRTEVAHSGAKRSTALASDPRSWLGSETKVTGGERRLRGCWHHRPRTSSHRRTSYSRVRPRANGSAARCSDRAQLPAGSRAENIRKGSTSNENVVLLHCPDRTGADAWNAGFEALQTRGNAVFGSSYWYDDLLLDYVSRIERVFAYRSEVGVIAFWTKRTIGRRSFEAPLCPDPEHQVRAHEATPASAFRAEAFGEAAPFRKGMPHRLRYL
jgi:hypothetical protein